MSKVLQDWLINKLNGYFIILYGNDYLVFAGIMEGMNNLVASFLLIMHAIPPRRRLGV